MNRRELLNLIGFASLGLGMKQHSAKTKKNKGPIVLSTWHNQSITANQAAWKVLESGGNALDAVETGVQVCENDIMNCCVGLGANPDRDGIVTLDACVMNHKFEIGSVAALERIKSPVHAARMVMEKTPHVMLVGEGAQQFALAQGAVLEDGKLSDHAGKAYEEWLKKSEYAPKINREKNHDTIGMIAMDAAGNLSGACTTSGLSFKMHGRVGDSPIIGAGLYVDNRVGAATATGNGEEVIRICGSFLVVELMRKGYHPEQACKKAVERIREITPGDPSKLQIGFIALAKDGTYGGYSLVKGFDFGVNKQSATTVQYEAKHLL